MADVVDLIEKDHREVEQLFSEYKSSGDTGIAARICDELTKHTFGEESAVYPVIAERVNGGQKLSEEAVEGHKEARQLIGRVRNSTDNDHIRELMTELKQAIEHHVEEEEDEMLPLARESLPSDTLDEMGRRFEDAKQAAGKA